MDLKQLENYHDVLFEKLNQEMFLLNELFIPNSDFYEYDAEPILKLQSLTKLIIQKLNLPLGKVLVYFESNLNHPGQIEFKEDEYYVEISSKFEDDYYSIGSILAHEIMHLFLHKKQIWLNNELNNEIFTDISAIYFGLGLLILNGQKSKREVREGIYNDTYYDIKQSLGYLPALDLAYLLNRYLYYFRPTKFDKSILNKRALEVYNNGKREFESELENFNKAKKTYRKLIELKNRYSKNFCKRFNYKSDFAEFEIKLIPKFVQKCPFCLKSYNMPDINKRINFQCKRCGLKFEL